MRTTVTLEPDLVAKVKDLAHRRGLSFKQVLNDLIRQGLSRRPSPGAQLRYQVEPHRGGFRPGVDPGKLNQLVDQLEVEDFVAEARR
ncbi:MAG: antitoxin [Myxococcales bacterium]|nr:antitoxin [Myxococcales bacterium]